MPSAKLPSFVGGHNESKDVHRLEKALVLLMRRVEVLESHVAWSHRGAWQNGAPSMQTVAAGHLGPLAKIPDGEEDCD
jgi:hypothetical protein